MTTRPYVLLSVAMSIDGLINDETPNGHPLSNEEDFDRVDHVRADCDAILIGAGTLRNDNPRMTIKSAERRAARLAAGKHEHLTKIVVTASGDIDPSLRWFHSPGNRLIYTTEASAPSLRRTIGALAEVVSLGPTIDFTTMLNDLGDRGTETLMVEGGEQIHTELLTQDLVDEIQLVVAPLLIGSGPRFLGRTKYLW
ncbi:MAG: dihydrofolate reductase family protein, partial [Acidimicrobiia bacterium]|nr:dihydrofolate reductase family protein [Acidimicrobiia bacterium]